MHRGAPPAKAQLTDLAGRNTLSYSGAPQGALSAWGEEESDAGTSDLAGCDQLRHGQHPHPPVHRGAEQGHRLPPAPSRRQGPHRDEIAKGYEFAKDQYVILEDDDFENLPVASQHTIALTNFVPLEQIEPASFEKTYYLEPEETGTKPFALLIRALEEKGILAIGKLALRSRESLCALRASNNRLFLSTLFYADELKIDPEIDLSAVAVEQDELDIALKLIDMLTKPFQPEAETDQYRAALMERITAKIDGREIVEVKATAPAPSVDLIAALKASIEATERDGAAAKSGSNGKAARKKAPSSRKAAAKS